MWYKKLFRVQPRSGALPSPTTQTYPMARNARFGQLLNEGITSIAKRHSRKKQGVEEELGERTGYSMHNVQHWQRGNAPEDGAIVEEIVRFCAANGRVDRQWAQSMLTATQYRDAGALLGELFREQPRLFLSYQRHLQPDEGLALDLARALSRDHSVFFDQVEEFDQAWAARLGDELRRTDFFIVLLSADSVNNEVVLAEIKRAATLFEQTGQPRLLPVRVDFRAPFTGLVARQFDEVGWAHWGSGADTERLVEEIKRALDGVELSIASAEAKQDLLRADAAPASIPSPSIPSPAAPTPSDELPAGAIPLDSAYYIERPGDAVASRALASPSGATVVIKGPRQVGKTSLLVRMMQQAEEAEQRVAFLDFQMLNSQLGDADHFFRLFARLLSFRLGVADGTDLYWQLPMPNPFRTTEYVAEHVLKQLEAEGVTSVLLAMDEVETMFETSYRTDFFGMLRAWHSYRAINPRWRKFNFILVTSTEPYFFIDNLNQSPFNVGEVIEMEPFDRPRVDELNGRYGAPFTDKQVAALHRLLNGQPFLTRRACYLAAQGRLDGDALSRDAAQIDGPFGDHLRRLLMMLHEKPGFVAALRQVLSRQEIDDKVALFGLRGAGLVREQGGRIVLANELYAAFFARQFGS